MTISDNAFGRKNHLTNIQEVRRVSVTVKWNATWEVQCTLNDAVQIAERHDPLALPQLKSLREVLK